MATEHVQRDATDASEEMPQDTQMTDIDALDMDE